MSTLNVNYPNLSPGYPGGYIPNPLIFETLVKEQSVKEIKNKSDISILEDENYYKVELVAPGFKRENFLVSINENCCLSVTAMHTESEMAEIRKYQKHPLEYVSFTREIDLPENIDTDFVTAEYKSGILSIWFSKTEKPGFKRSTMIIVY